MFHADGWEPDWGLPLSAPFSLLFLHVLSLRHCPSLLGRSNKMAVLAWGHHCHFPFKSTRALHLIFNDVSLQSAVGRKAVNKGRWLCWLAASRPAEQWFGPRMRPSSWPYQGRGLLVLLWWSWALSFLRLSLHYGAGPDTFLRHPEDDSALLDVGLHIYKCRKFNLKLLGVLKISGYSNVDSKPFGLILLMTSETRKPLLHLHAQRLTQHFGFN